MKFFLGIMVMSGIVMAELPLRETPAWRLCFDWNKVMGLSDEDADKLCAGELLSIEDCTNFCKAPAVKRRIADIRTHMVWRKQLKQWGCPCD